MRLLLSALEKSLKRDLRRRYLTITGRQIANEVELAAASRASVSARAARDTEIDTVRV